MNHQSAVLVRHLGLADRDAYFQLRLRGLKALPESFGQSYAEALAKGASQHEGILEPSRAVDGDFLLGAYVSDERGREAELVGAVGLKRSQREKERHKATVVGMYVAPEAAGRGIGRALLDELLRRASKVRGLLQIQLMVGTHNEAARGLYESVGFRQYGRETGALNVQGVFYDADLLAFFLQRPQLDE